jgi:c(7)-type cytochrome triheme protein
MQKSHSTVLLILMLMIAGLALLGQDKKPPEKIVFAAKPGNVTFVHATHLKAVKGDCKACHDSLFQQNKTAPLDFKAGMHKPAEAAKKSCGHCHNPEGPAFETKGNCAKCHVKA